MGKFLLVVLVLAVAIYLTVRFLERRATGPGGRGGAPLPPPRPMGPDDDPDFLWRLERDERRRRKQDPDDGE